MNSVSHVPPGSDPVEEAIERSRRVCGQVDDDLGILVTPLHDHALRSHRADPRGGPLTGVTLGVKDVIFESSAPASAQSDVRLAEWPEEQPEATAVSRLKEAGAVVVGKTATMEYALGVQDGSGRGPVSRNPWMTDRWAGGSSSGSGSGVLTGCFDAALATDTTGSLRIPAAYTGTTGLKATRGRVPTTGTYPLAPSLDAVGPVAGSIDLCARLLQVMAGPDDADPVAPDVEAGDYLSALTADVSGLRVGVDHLTAYADGGVDPAQPAVFERALKDLDTLGMRRSAVEVPGYQLLNVVGNVIMLAEAHEIHHDALVRDWARYGRGARWVFTAGESISSRDYLRAQRLRATLSQQVQALFDHVDLLITPTCHLGAPRLDGMHPLDPSTYLASMHTTAWSVTGHPVAVVPAGFTGDGLPLSLSIVGPYWCEDRVVAAAAAFQRLTDHHRQRPAALSLATQESR
ncbi:amidase [Streptomyces olivaceus]|uniref:amidase n=1 Tax=Streptomyces olivaceus TaxID=47716 RepID=UPI0022ED8160|nr:amidase [Streptomyces olivaceus]GHI90659.1 glutamyl-tRNA amidotransferase subunit A [Streptomyces olivaceus]